MSLILRENEKIDFLNKRFSILGEGEKSCQVESCTSFMSRTTELRCLVGLALQGIGFMNIIISFSQNSRPLDWGSSPGLLQSLQFHVRGSIQENRHVFC